MGSAELGDLGFLPVFSVVSILVLKIASADGVVFLVKWVAIEGDGGVCLPLFLVTLARAGFFSF